MNSVKFLILLFSAVSVISDGDELLRIELPPQGGTPNSSLPIFSAVAPKTVYPDSTYNITVFIEPTTPSKTLTVIVKIMSENTTVVSSTAMIPTGQEQDITIFVKTLTAPVYNLSVTVQDAKGNKYENRTAIFVSLQDKSILIQTDKPIYKPGELVQYRVILLDLNLKPMATDYAINVEIRDPQNNLIRAFEDETVSDGFFKDAFTLSDEPNMGSWSIVASYNEPSIQNTQQQIISPIYYSYYYIPDIGPATTTNYFQVEEYVLPTYGVTVTLPTYLTYADLNVKVTVKVEYTYGKPVSGSCTLVAKRAYSSDDTDGRVSRTFQINGTYTSEVNIDNVFTNTYGYDYKTSDQNIEFDVSCTEYVTGIVMSGSATVTIYVYDFTITQVQATNTLQPGLPYSVIYKIAKQDGTPVSDSAPDALKIWHGFSYDVEGSRFTSPIPENGLVRFNFEPPTNVLNTPLEIIIRYKQVKATFYLPGFSVDTDDDEDVIIDATYIQIQLLSLNSQNVVVDPVQTVGKNMTINVNVTKPIQTINYLIEGRQLIIASGQIHLPTPVKEYNLTIICPQNADPDATIIVYTVLKESNELLVASIDFTARQPNPGNFLTIELSTNQSQPADNITLTLTSTKNSRVALRGIDQSLLLLTTDQDITQQTLDNALASTGCSSCYYYGAPSYPDFDNAQVVIITNGYIPTPPTVIFPFPRPIFELSDSASLSSVKAPGLGEGNTANAGGSNLESTTRARTNFPETWIWLDFLLSNSNTYKLLQTVPDTITSFIISGYSLNPNFGVGIAEPKKLTVFKPFFISLNLPYSVVEGETVYLQVLVHNSLGTSQERAAVGDATVLVILYNTDQAFEFADTSMKNATSQTQYVTVPPNSVTLVTFKITMLEIGLPMLTVFAAANTTEGSAADKLIQPLRVIPPGQQQQRSTAVILNPSHNTSSAVLTASFPDVRVSGADSVKLIIISDMLGLVSANLQQLLQLPQGCGEQNMMMFAIDIVVLDYINVTKGLSTNIQNQAVQYLQTGYQQELTYRYNDGSFSLFSSPNYISSFRSTWLTAYVARYFIEAKRYITIDDNVIQTALDYLITQQTSDGGFYDAAPFLPYLRATGTNGGVALAAFVLLTLVDANANGYKQANGTGYTANINLTCNFITKEISKTTYKNDVYATVLSAYAATVAGCSSQASLFTKMKNLATNDNTFTYYQIKVDPPTSTAASTIIYYPYEYYVQPVTIEMTAYALLTYIARGQAANAGNIVRFLVNQQNAYGGFSSTQDTVAAITALAKYAALTKSKVTNIMVNFMQGSVDQHILITDKNATLLQEYPLTSNTTSVTVTATGQGTALVMLSWSFYVLNNNLQPAFVVTVDTSGSHDATLVLEVCVQYNGTSVNSSLANVEVNVPSGYIISTESQDLTNLSKLTGFGRYDLVDANTQLIIYFSAITKNQTCFTVEANQNVYIANPKPSYVSVFEYYDTTKTATFFYNSPLT